MGWGAAERSVGEGVKGEGEIREGVRQGRVLSSHRPSRGASVGEAIPTAYFEFRESTDDGGVIYFPEHVLAVHVRAVGWRISV